MKPAEFEYYSPSSVEETLDLLAELGYDVKVLAGGQSLIPAMNFRMANPPALIDLNGIPELRYIREAEDGGLSIGAMTIDSEVEYSPLVKARYQVLDECMPAIAHAQIRNRGTFGGNIAHADPTGQLPAVCMALGGSAVLRSTEGERVVPLDEFYIGPFTTVIEPNELLVEVILPPLPARTGTAYTQMARQVGAQALVGIGALVTLAEDGTVDNARIGMLSVGEMPMLALEAANRLVGQAPTDEVIAAAAEAAAMVDIDPPSDIHCTADYRRHLTRVLVDRALKLAVQRAQA